MQYNDVRSRPSLLVPGKQRFDKEKMNKDAQSAASRFHKENEFTS